MTNQMLILSCRGNGFGITQGLAQRDLKQDSKIMSKTITDTQKELIRWQKAVSDLKCQLEAQCSDAEGNANKDEAEILNAHLLILEDPSLVDAVTEAIQEGQCCVECALNQQVQKLTAKLEGSRNPFIRERAIDICDIACQLEKTLDVPDTDKKTIKVNSKLKDGLNTHYILVKDLLFPSDIVHFDRNKYNGIVCARGSWTTHAAILAKSKSIPMAILNDPEDINKIPDDSELILDVDKGSLIINPDEEELNYFRETVKRLDEDKLLADKLKNNLVKLSNGKNIRFEANISGPESIPEVLESGACGVGLFRTEFLYYDHNNLPSEEEQYQIYLQVLKGMNGLPVTFRTFDIGGDKLVPALNLPKEMNPFLGYRAIRIALAEPELFKTQIRAILRASAGYPIQIMFPMISSMEELEQAKKLVFSVRDDLKTKNIACASDFKIGMMVEIPAAAVLADEFAKKCDFFSIGTNDLIQYTLACDRLNEKVQHLYRADHPAVLNLIRNVAEAAHANGIEVAICGEAAASTDLCKTWVELGIDALSMSPSLLPKLRLNAFKQGLLKIDC